MRFWRRERRGANSGKKDGSMQMFFDLDGTTLSLSEQTLPKHTPSLILWSLISFPFQLIVFRDAFIAPHALGPNRPPWPIDSPSFPPTHIAPIPRRRRIPVSSGENGE